MATPLLPLYFLFLLATVLAEPAPAPGRIPKVYNALITSNQNLEPSKAFPVYQPVIHDFGFPYQPVFYGDLPLGQGQPSSAEAPKQPNAVQPEPAAATETAKAVPAPTEAPTASVAPPEDTATAAPPLPPNTQSPIPLNQFGLPSQVIPLGRIDPAYNGFNQIGPFRYSYPSVRFYDPFDLFNFNPYVNYPTLYRPLSNVLEPSLPAYSGFRGVPVAAAKEAPGAPADQPSQSPPPEPKDISVLNYSANDPAIPNVPPPPLPQGGLKPDDSQ